jgi:thiamine phosphate synthase YjbQ (UPF0047 family)
MIFLKNYFVTTTEKVDVLGIVHEINRTIKESNITEGLVVVIVPEAGAGLSIFEPLPDLAAKVKEALKLYPGEGVETKNPRKEPVDVGPRVISAMMARSLAIPLSGGRLLLGVREEPFLIDLEKRVGRREFVVQIMGEAPEQEEGRGQGPHRR